jgi:hypothetical protein
MTDVVRTGRQWPPTPILAAVVLSGLVALGLVVAAIVSVATGHAGGAVFPLLIAAAIGVVTFGTWRGQHASWQVLLALAAFSLITGVLTGLDPDSGPPVVVTVARVVVSGVIFALLVAPASARAYFRQPDEPDPES